MSKAKSHRHENGSSVMTCLALSMALATTNEACEMREPPRLRTAEGQGAPVVIDKQIEPAPKSDLTPLPTESLDMASIIGASRQIVRSKLGEPDLSLAPGEVDAGVLYDRDHFHRESIKLIVSYDSRHQAVMITVQAPNADKNIEPLRKWLGLSIEPMGLMKAGKRKVKVSRYADEVSFEDVALEPAFTAEVQKRERQEKARAVEREEKSSAAIRKSKAEEIERAMLLDGSNVTVRATGKYGKTLSVGWVFCNRAIVSQMAEGVGMGGEFIKGSEIVALGFDRIVCTDPYTGDGSSISWK